MKELLPYLPRPSHYLGNEVNSIHKDGLEVDIRVALAFPDVYEIGMSYVGQRILYHILNKKRSCWAERVFAPSLEASNVLREHGKKLCALESGMELSSFDLIAFSLTHELCYTNILYMLDLAGVPFESRDRDESFPLVAAGGGAVFNAEPIADFFDFFVLGDGENVFPEIVEKMAEAKIKASPRRKFLEEISKFPGIYVPCFFSAAGPRGILRPLLPGYDRVEKALVEDLDKVDYPRKQIVPFGKPIHDRLSVEVARGCTRGCRFCHAGMTYRPVRERSPENILKIISNGLNATGFEEVSFLSLSTGDYSLLMDIFGGAYARCAREQVSMALPSLRAGSVSRDLMQLMASIRQTGATIAPEAGTQRLRDVINKGICERDLLQHTQELFELGWNSIKLYFMIGLPTEEESDLNGIIELCRKVKATAGNKAKRMRITASISPFVPKTHTPFQWEKQLSAQEVQERIEYLKDLSRSCKWLNLKWQSPEMSTLEGVFSRGGRELSTVLKTAFDHKLFFASWNDHFVFRDWQRVFEENEVDMHSYLQARDMEGPLPWDHLHSGVSKRFLLDERKKAYQGILTHDCREQKCVACGVCNHNGRKSGLQVQAANKEISPRVAAANKAETEQAGAQPPGKEVDPGHKALHLRLWYSKMGLCRWLSQLELQKIFDRAMRRSALPMSFSRGFHPLPLLSFGRALPVGVNSLCEWVNVFFQREIEDSQLLVGLNRNLPEGIRVNTVQRISMGKHQPQASAEKFRITFPAGREYWLRTTLADFNSCSDFEVEKKGKKRSRVVDLKPLLKRSKLANNVLDIEFDWSEEYLSPIFVLKNIFKGFELDGTEILKLKQFF
ncbi:MAG: TIGR03960 family B12-binding radical SAM protein [Desulfovibrionales bacterium]